MNCIPNKFQTLDKFCERKKYTDCCNEKQNTSRSIVGKEI